MAHIDDPKTQRANMDYIKTSMKEPLLERDVEFELARRWRENGDEAALHTLVRSYMRLVVSTAGRFRNYGLPMGDLVQEGNVGLMQAAARFEPQREVRFSTYATWWIRSAMQDYVLRNWSIVRTGTTAAQKSLFFNLRRLRARIEDASGTRLGDEGRKTIAAQLRVKIAEVESMETRLGAHDQGSGGREARRAHRRSSGDRGRERRRMSRREVPLQRLPHGAGLALPDYATELSAGVDLLAAVEADVVLRPGERRLIPSGIAIALPAGTEAQVRPRSGLALKHGITVLNAPGTIDADYRGEVGVILINLGQEPFTINRGDRIAQLVIAAYTRARWQVVEALDDSARGAGGFGSTGATGGATGGTGGT